MLCEVKRLGGCKCNDDDDDDTSISGEAGPDPVGV